MGVLQGANIPDYNPVMPDATNLPLPGSAQVRRGTGEADLALALAVRWRVFVEEQGVPAELEHDEADAISTHVLAELAGQVVGTGRLVFDDDSARIGRVSVLPDFRHRGIGSQVVAALEAEASARGFIEVTLHAQTYVQELYDKNGYAVSGPEFLEAGIDHVPMIKLLKPPELARNSSPRPVT
jgi:predicted GNAT family N-acyltransferase